MTAPDAKQGQAPLVVSTAPERIWLQVSDEDHHADEPFPKDVGDDITWCQHSVMACEVEYVRADKIATLERENAELAAALQMAVKQSQHDMIMTGDELRVCETALALRERK
jgi:hypothetical protein